MRRSDARRMLSASSGSSSFVPVPVFPGELIQWRVWCQGVVGMTGCGPAG